METFEGVLYSQVQYEYRYSSSDSYRSMHRSELIQNRFTRHKIIKCTLNTGRITTYSVTNQFRIDTL